MQARVAASATWSRADSEAPLASGMHLAPEPPRPERVSPGAWRRMSRLGRLAAVVTDSVLVGRADTASLPLLWGTAWGEFGSTAAFLRTLFTKGPAGASPLHFQNAVHNAPAGHLSIAFGLRGPSETLCAGPLTTLRVFQRALAWLRTREEPVLVVLADELGPDVQTGLTLAGGEAAFGEGAAAFVLEPGVGLRLDPGGAWSRAQPYPGESAPTGAEGHDLRLGLFPAADAIQLVRAGRVSFPGWTLRLE